MGGKRGTYRGHRTLKTTQERRANGKRNFINYDEYKVAVRPSRNMSNLVERWDDLIRRPTRSWKKHRKNQWKPRDVGV